MKTLTYDDLETLDETLGELARRSTLVKDKSESEVVTSYLSEMIANMLEIRDFLQSPVADIIYDRPAPAEIDNALELPDTPSA